MYTCGRQRDQTCRSGHRHFNHQHPPSLFAQVFVARNIANLVVNTDMSLLAVLEYAVHVLEVC